MSEQAIERFMTWLFTETDAEGWHPRVQAEVRGRLEQALREAEPRDPAAHPDSPGVWRRAYANRA